LLDKRLDDRQRALFKELAGAAGQTRDWDILTALLCEVAGPAEAPLDGLRVARNAASERLTEFCYGESLERADDMAGARHVRFPSD
jgi:hypothetical protein